MNKLGWIPDLPDHRDLEYRQARALPERLPTRVDLRPLMPPIYDQAELGSCVANATAAAFEFDLRLQSLPEFTPSRLFIYYNTRRMEDAIEQDAGCMIRDAAKSINVDGVCTEPQWPYVPTRFASTPPEYCYATGKANHSVKYMRVAQSELWIRGAMVSGFPVVLGITVYPSLMTEEVANSGVIPYPGSDEAPLGGHAVILCGYDQNRRVFILRNSWGTGWGQDGYATIPYAYILNENLCDDLWVIQSVVAGVPRQEPSDEWLAETFGWNEK